MIPGMQGVGGGFSGLYLPFTPDLMDRIGGAEGLKAVVADGSNGLNASGFVPEDLEMTAHLTLWGREDLHLSRELPEVDAYSVFHEFEVVDSYGNIMSPIFQPEAGLGAQSAYEGKRDITRIVTLSEVNKVSGLARAQKNVNVLGSTDPFKSNREAVMRLHLFKRAVNLVYVEAGASTSKLRFKGLLEQFFEKNQAAAFVDKPRSMDPALYIDKRGADLTRADVEAGSTSMFVNGWGQLNRVYMDPDVSQGFQGEIESNFPVERVTMGQTPNEFYIGSPVAGVKAQGGIAQFRVDNSLHPRFFFTDPYDEAVRSGKTLSVAQGAPGKPAAAPAVAIAGGAAGSLWQAADIPVAPSIKFKVQPANDFGIGQASDVSAAAAVAVGGKITVTWNSSADALSYRVLRNSVEQPNRYFMIGEVKNDAAALSFVDLNHVLPGTSIVVGLEMLTPKTASNRLNARAKDNAVRWAKLEGLRTKPLAPIGDFDWEMILERTAPELVQKLRMRVWFNVGNSFTRR